jgi:nicotinamide mononucleotide transporter
MADNKAKSLELFVFPAFGGVVRRTFLQGELYADMGLQGIFAGALLYGRWQWTRGRSATGDVLITGRRTYEVLISLVAGVVAAGTLGFLLDAHTDASLRWPPP